MNLTAATPYAGMLTGASEAWTLGHRLQRSPVFLIGAERSGSTMLRLMLDHHPRIAFNLESEFLVSQLGADGRPPAMGPYREYLRQDRVFAHSGFTIDERLAYLDLVDDFLCQKSFRDRKPIVGATVHYGFSHLQSIWPRARYVYLYRDPRDVAQSVVGMGWAGNVYVAAEWWLKAESEWDRLRPILDRAQWIELRFEDLVSRPQDELTRVCQFMGVSFDPAMFDYPRHTRYALPDPTAALRWQRTLGRNPCRWIEARLGDRLAARGYRPSGHPPLSIGRLGDAALRLHARLLALRRRVQDYGLRIVVGSLIARRLNLRAWQHRLAKRIDEIVDANLQ